MKDQNSINEKIRAAEQELAALDAKRTALKGRIEQLQSLKQSIADEQLQFDQSSKSNVTNDSTQEEKIALGFEAVRFSLSTLFFLHREQPAPALQPGFFHRLNFDPSRHPLRYYSLDWQRSNNEIAP